ncbi:class III lanthipeptide [Bacillus velezensis]|nr:class III lanthipeptide [Bacillus velezensis]
MEFQQLNEGSEVEAVKGKGAYLHYSPAAVGTSTISNNCE